MPLTAGSKWSDFQNALGGMLSALKAAEVGGEIGAAFASGGIAAGEIGGSPAIRDVPAVILN